jgi:hypothetical protein
MPEAILVAGNVVNAEGVYDIATLLKLGLGPVPLARPDLKLVSAIHSLAQLVNVQKQLLHLMLT